PVGRVEPGKVLADDLGGLVALDPLRTRIPAGHPPVWIEHEDRVVLHGLDHEAEAFLAAADVLFVAAALREVARDLGEPDELSGRIAEGGDHDVGPEEGAILADPPAFVLEAPLRPRRLQLVCGPAPGQ